MSRLIAHLAHVEILMPRIEESMTMPDSDVPVLATVTNCEKSHDVGLVRDLSGTRGRAHHVAFWVDTRDELLRAADTYSAPGVR